MKWETTTLREICEEERQRLLGMPSGRNWPIKWMVEQFGPTLMEKDYFSDIVICKSCLDEMKKAVT